MCSKGRWFWESIISCKERRHPLFESFSQLVLISECVFRLCIKSGLRSMSEFNQQEKPSIKVFLQKPQQIFCFCYLWSSEDPRKWFLNWLKRFTFCQTKPLTCRLWGNILRSHLSECSVRRIWLIGLRFLGKLAVAVLATNHTEVCLFVVRIFKHSVHKELTTFTMSIRAHKMALSLFLTVWSLILHCCRITSSVNPVEGEQCLLYMLWVSF